MKELGRSEKPYHRELFISELWQGPLCNYLKGIVRNKLRSTGVRGSRLTELTNDCYVDIIISLIDSDKLEATRFDNEGAAVRYMKAVLATRVNDARVQLEHPIARRSAHIRAIHGDPDDRPHLDDEGNPLPLFDCEPDAFCGSERVEIWRNDNHLSRDYLPLELEIENLTDDEREFLLDIGELLNNGLKFEDLEEKYGKTKQQLQDRVYYLRRRGNKK